MRRGHWRPTRGASRHFEGEAEGRDSIPRVVIGVGELRYAIQQLRLGRRPLIDAGMQIDDVHAWRTAGREVDHDIARLLKPQA
jgi:hypothetical protein